MKNKLLPLLPPLITFEELENFIKQFNQKHSSEQEKAVKAAGKLFGRAK